MPRSIACCLAFTLLTGVSALAQDGGATIIPKREVNEVLLQGLDRLATGRPVSDLVVRHLNVGEENLGVSVVQRTKVEVRDTIIGGAHTHVDEIYYIVNKESSVGRLLGPREGGEIRGGVLQYVEPGDIAIIPKGMPHGWHKIDTDTISYIIFRADPDKVMDLKNE